MPRPAAKRRPSFSPRSTGWRPALRPSPCRFPTPTRCTRCERTSTSCASASAKGPPEIRDRPRLQPLDCIRWGIDARKTWSVPVFSLVEIVMKNAWLFLASLVLALPVQAQKVEEITYLLPAPPFLPAFAPWMLAQQRGYFAQEG